MKRKNSVTRRALDSVLKAQPWMAAALLLLVAAVVSASLIPPQLLRRIIDENLLPLRTEGLTEIAVLYFVVLAAIGALDFAKGALLTVLGQKLVCNMRAMLMEKTTRLPASYFSAHAPAEITSRVTVDVEYVSALFSDGVVSMCIDCCKIVGIVVSISMFSKRLGLAVMCLVPVIVLLTRFFQKRILAAQMQNLSELSHVNAHIAESVKNVRMIKLFSKEAYMERLYQKRLSANFATVDRVNFYDACYSPVIQLVRAAVIAAIVLLSSGGNSVLGISVGMLAASIELVSGLFAPIDALGTEIQNVQKGVSGIRRVNAFDCEPEEGEKHGRLSPETVRAFGRGMLQFEHVSFSYGTGTEILHDVSLSIENGQRVTFAGRTGVGKTTLFRLVMGLLKPTSGRILLAGTDVCEIPNAEKRRLFGYVEQHFSFVHGTVGDQITLGDPKISPDMVEHALSFVGLWETVLAMPDGLDTVIHGDGDFSQGQKQLLSIARAIAADPAILLLDEVTANLDSLTEARVVGVLQRAGNGRTVLSVSHREAAMRDCDLLVILKDGSVCDAGAPETVFTRNCAGFFTQGVDDPA